MASLQKIRNHGVFLLVVVGLAMLAFILGDFINSGSSFFNRSREYVGEIAGEDVHYTDFEQAREQLLDVYKIESGSRDVDEQFQQNSSNQVWQSLVLDYTLTAEAKKAGVEKVVFDRNGYLYHGRVQSLADAAREAGLKF